MHTISVVYVLHFDEPVGNARHYIGVTTNLRQRLNSHFSGYGATLTTKAVQQLVTMRLAYCYPGDRKNEKQAKQSTRIYCGICRPRARLAPTARSGS